MKLRRQSRALGRILVGVLFVSFQSAPHPQASPASLVTASGDLAEYLNSIPIPGANTEAFVIPGQNDITTWRLAVDAVLEGEYEAAATQADPLGYDLVKFTDDKRNQHYFVFRERMNDSGRPLQGLGTVVFNPAPCRSLCFQVPHPLHDTNTREEGIALFLELKAVALILTGTHRCANSQLSPCDGTTSICRGNTAPYPVSDVAHNLVNFYHTAHEEISSRFPDLVSVSVHGFAWRPGDPDAIISNGTATDREDGLSIRLARQYNTILNELAVPLSAGSCNEKGGPDRLCGTTNVQGRFANGSPDPCERGVTSVSGPERFIHIEQSCALRQMSNCGRPTLVPFQVAVDAFSAVFPCASSNQGR